MDKQSEKQFYEELGAMTTDVDEATAKAAQTILDKIKSQSATYGEAARKVQLLKSHLGWSRQHDSQALVDRMRKLLDEEMRALPIKRNPGACIMLEGKELARGLLEQIREGAR